MSLTCQQIGLLFTLAGTVALAFSIRVKNGDKGDPVRKLIAVSKQKLLLTEPSDIQIIRLRFYGGLTLIFIGTMLQF